MKKSQRIRSREIDVYNSLNRLSEHKDKPIIEIMALAEKIVEEEEKNRKKLKTKRKDG